MRESFVYDAGAGLAGAEASRGQQTEGNLGECRGSATGASLRSSNEAVRSRSRKLEAGESAGINRLGVADERAVQGRSSNHPDPESCARRLDPDAQNSQQNQTKSEPQQRLKRAKGAGHLKPPLP